MSASHPYVPYVSSLIKEEGVRESARVLFTACAMLSNQDIAILCTALGAPQGAAHDICRFMAMSGVPEETRVIGIAVALAASRASQSNARGTGMAGPGGQVMIANGYGSSQSIWQDLTAMFGSDASSIFSGAEYSKISSEFSAAMDRVAKLVAAELPIQASRLGTTGASSVVSMPGDKSVSNSVISLLRSGVLAAKDKAADVLGGVVSGLTR